MFGEESRKLCTTVTLFGPYCYNRVPMGLTISPGFTQSRMEEILCHIEKVSIYINDAGVFTNTRGQYIEVVGRVLKLLQDNNFMINPLKCKWSMKETDWLGY